MSHLLLSLLVLLWSYFRATTVAADDVRLFRIRQPLDHFRSTSSSVWFDQRFYVDWSYRDGQSNVDGMPVLVYLGGEAPIDKLLGSGGTMTIAASHLHALVVYIEHRFYGQSIPTGSIDTALADPNVRSGLTSEQALMDTAKIILALKANLSIAHSPVITFGCSYSGMLAARFRMKYPNITNGSLASSAPILMSANLPPERQYCYIVSRDFENESEDCYKRISRSWKLIDDMASSPVGLETLSQVFSTCSPLPSTTELKTYLAQIYDYTAQYNGRFGSISELCHVITRAPEKDILKAIGGAVMSLTEMECNNVTTTAAKPYSILDPTSPKAWDWQVCNELVPYQYCGQGTMFEKSSFNLSTFSDMCFSFYGVYSHPRWNSTSYGGHDLKTVGNVIFSNGLIDPYSGASILEDVSDTVVAITTKQGSHCLDITPAERDDPKWLKEQRNKELKIIAQWLNMTWASANNLRWATWCKFLIVLVGLHAML